MSWRTIVISSRCKLDYKMGFMVIRDDVVRRVFMDEIAVLMIENPAVSFTGCLIEALVEKKIKVIFCDSKRNPLAELVPHHGSHDSSRKIKTQFNWSDDLKGEIWRDIVAEKIRNQASLLWEIGKNDESEKLRGYINEIEPHDSTNREGHAAKVYFNALFGMDFTRSADNPTNACLNYGYSIILSAINREVSGNGYLTQLGIFHDNMFNHFNLSCDLMEPLRIIVDKVVYYHDPVVFGDEEKYLLMDLLNNGVTVDNTNQTFLNAIRIYVHSVFDALNDNDTSKIKFLGVL